MASNLVRAAVAAILASALSGAFAADTIKVAFLGSLSGPFALQGEETLKNIQAAVDNVNARGGVLDGRKLEIVIFDNKGNPQESLIVLKQAIDKDIRYVISGVSNIAYAPPTSIQHAPDSGAMRARASTKRWQAVPSSRSSRCARSRSEWMNI